MIMANIDSIDIGYRLQEKRYKLKIYSCREMRMQLKDLWLILVSLIQALSYKKDVQVKNL